jgi:hypothetical protein
MAKVTLRPAIVWVLVIWAAGALAIVALSGLLNVGVTEQALRECVAEQIIPAEDCEAVLQSVEDAQPPGLLPGALIVWTAGVLLLGVLWYRSERPRAE